MTVPDGFEMILPFLKPIEHLILDPTISEIMLNGGGLVFIERSGQLSEVTDAYIEEKSLLIAVKNIARRLGDDISETRPILDSRLPDGSRIAAVVPPCSLRGVTLTIRKFVSRDFKMEDLVQIGTLDTGLANLLREQLLQRRNILISGGTGVGKSTMLGILGSEIPDEDRIVLIEDTAEIHLSKRNLVRFEARQAQPGAPGVTVRELLKATLRHRPDRIILGEIRGGEAFDLLQLLNTGHSGTLSTIHANSAQQALTRLANCVLQSGIDLPYKSIKSNIGDSIDLVVQLERRSGMRRVSEALFVRDYDLQRDEYRFEPSERIYKLPVAQLV
jgi:pilus assembly protein CpaF